MIVVVAVIVFVFIIMAMVMLMVMFVFMIFMSVFARILRRIGIAIPVVVDEIHVTVAGVVLMAVSLPVTMMFWRHAQVQRC